MQIIPDFGILADPPSSRVSVDSTYGRLRVCHREKEACIHEIFCKGLELAFEDTSLAALLSQRAC